MSYCKKDGKDVIMFLTEEDLKSPSKVSLPVEAEPEPGLILPSGDINWNCPCLGGMATGPCGYEFRSAFSCFHYSKEEPKGSECFDDFRRMTECMAQYPKLYETESDDPLAFSTEDDDKTDEQNLDVETTDNTNSSDSDSQHRS